MEALETRMLLSAVSWTGLGGDGSWTNPSNWTGNALPGPGDDATINVAGSPTISLISATTQQIHSLTTVDPIMIDGPLAVATSVDFSADFRLSSGGSLEGGTYVASGGARLLIAPGQGQPVTMDAITIAAGTTALADASGANFSLIKNGMTSEWVSSRYAVSGSGAHFVGTQTLGGTGIVIVGNGVTTGGFDVLDSSGPATLTIANTLTIQGPGEVTIASPDATIIDNATDIQPFSGNILDIQGNVILNDPNYLAIRPSPAAIGLTGNLLGNTTNTSNFMAAGQFLFDGTGTATSPQLCEVMSQDAGPAASSLTGDFAYGDFRVFDTYVKLVDQADNTPGSGPEALYATTLEVNTGTTLDLNGLHVYAGRIINDGTILNGTVTPINTSTVASVTTLASSAPNANAGDTVMLTATVAPAVQSAFTPTGTVKLSLMGARRSAAERRRLRLAGNIF